MEAFVALLRNGFCVINDLLPKEHVLFSLTPRTLLDNSFIFQVFSNDNVGCSPSTFLITSIEKILGNIFDLLYSPMFSLANLLLMQLMDLLQELRTWLDSMKLLPLISTLVNFFVDLMEAYLQYIYFLLEKCDFVAIKIIPTYINLLLKLNDIPLISIAISCLQFAAVLFGVFGGFTSLLQSVNAFTTCITWANKMEEMKSIINVTTQDVLKGDNAIPDKKNETKKADELLAIYIIEDSIHTSMINSWSNTIDSLMNIIIGF